MPALNARFTMIDLLDIELSKETGDFILPKSSISSGGDTIRINSAIFNPVPYSIWMYIEQFSYLLQRQQIISLSATVHIPHLHFQIFW